MTLVEDSRTLTTDGTLNGKKVVVAEPEKLAIVPLPRADRSNLVDRSKNGTNVEVKPIEMENEFLGEPKVKLKTNRRVSYKVEISPHFGGTIDQELTYEIQAEFDFLSRTRDLEVNTYRTEILQDIVNKMVKGDLKWEGRTRVVIMNKGENPEAFVYPDGTIFISQSLINILDNLDEVAAILGHEVKHLLNETTLNIAIANFKNNGRDLGVAWFHEMLSDYGAPELLNKVGLNTLAFADAFTKIKEHFNNNRGIIHQAPNLRVIEQYLAHAVIDFEHSNKIHTPLPYELSKPSKPSNLEMVISILKDENKVFFEEYLLKLHPQDFGDVADIIYNHNGGITWRKEQAAKESLTKIITERLLETGLTVPQIRLFIYTLNDVPSVKYTTAQELIEVLPQAEDIFNNELFTKATLKIFGKDLKMDSTNKLTEYIKYKLELFSYEDFFQLVLTFKEIIGDNIPKTRDGNYLRENGKIYGLFSSDLPRNATLQDEINSMVVKYLENIVLSKPISDLNQSEAIKYFTKLKEIGFIFRVKLDESAFKKETVIIIEKAYVEVYGEKLILREEVVKNDIPEATQFSKEVDMLSVIEIKEKLSNAYKGYLESQSNPIEKQKMLAIFKIAIDSFLKAGEGRLPEIISGINPTEFDGWKNSERNIDIPLDELLTKYYSDDLLSFNVSKDNIINIIIHRNIIETFCDLTKYEGEIATELAEYYMNNPNNLLDISKLEDFELHYINSPIFKIADERTFENGQIDTINIEKLTSLKYVKELIVRFNKLHFDSLSQLFKFYDKFNFYILSNFSRVYLHSIFSDTLDMVTLFKSVRENLKELTSTSKLSVNDYPVLLDLLNNLFPESTEVTSIKKRLGILYLEDKNIDVDDKIIFFCSNDNLLGVEGAIVLGDQISLQKDYERFRSLTGSRYESYLKGEKSLSEVAKGDKITTDLVKNADILIQTASSEPTDKTSASTNIANTWLNLFGEQTEYLTKYKDRKIIFKRYLTRSEFISFKDIIQKLKNLSTSNRLIISLKTLSDTGGLLENVTGKEKLLKVINSGLKLKEGFIKDVISTAILFGNSSILGLPAAKILSPLLFRGLSSEAVDKDTIKAEKKYQASLLEDLDHALVSDTSDLLTYGERYINNPEASASIEAKNVPLIYLEIINNIKKRLGMDVNEDESSKEETKLDSTTEAIISALETSSLFVRALQVATQVLDLDPKMRERLQKTQDSMKNQTKLGFWKNMLGRTVKGSEEYDPEFASFMENDFISLDEYLGGGSLFTTYAATVKGPNKSTKRVVIKMLNPNSEALIKKVYDFSSDTLSRVIESSSGKSKEYAKLASTVLNLSFKWCLEDINDPNFAERDKAFRGTVNAFNEGLKNPLVDISEPVLASKKIKIEGLIKGKTLNSVLENPDIDKSVKVNFVSRLVNFFDFQFNHSPYKDSNGNAVYLFHSDPHTGNYMCNPSNPESPLSVIDRSMYLAMNQQERDIFIRLQKGKMVRFAYTFIKYCLEKSDLNKEERTWVMSSVFFKLATEYSKQKKDKKNDPMKFLDTILTEFTKHASIVPIEDPILPEDLDEIAPEEYYLVKYFESHPNISPLGAYKKLMKDTVFANANISEKEYKDILDNMADKGLLKRKPVEIPLEYRLMLRNIVAMQNLRKRFLS